MSLKKFLLSTTFVKNLIFSIIIIAVILLITFWGLKIYTHHGQANTVPDFNGLMADEAQVLASDSKLRFKIIDSAYVEEATPGSVIDQVPKPGFKVKENRTILITINSNSPEQVTLPKLNGISFRQAKVILENCGLLVGEISHKPSEYDNLVLEAFVDSSIVEPGDKFAKGTSVDIVVGKKSGYEKIQIPDILSLSIDEAKTKINELLLNLGIIIYDETILTEEDSLSARIWKQRPDPKITNGIEPGASIDIWVTIDQLKIDDAIGIDKTN